MASYQHSRRCIDAPITSPRRVESPQTSPRRIPPTSPSQSLSGLKKIASPMPSSDHLSYRSWVSTTQISATDVNKPLPQSSARSRTPSVYSGDSGYTRIIESYGDDEEIPPIPALLHPTATNTYQDTMSTLILHQDEVPLYTDVPKIEDRDFPASQSISTFQHTPFPDERWNSSAYDLSQSPVISEFCEPAYDVVSPISSGSWQQRTSYGFFLPQIVSPPLVTLEYYLSYDHERHHLPSPMSASVTEIGRPQLLPQPLRKSKIADMVFDSQNCYRVPSSQSLVRHVELLDIEEAQRRAAETRQRDLEARAAELVDKKSKVRESSLIEIAEAQRRKACKTLQGTSTPYEDQTEPRPKSVSSDSFVIYTGLRESVKAMIKQNFKQKKESRDIEKAANIQERERKMLISIAEEKYSAMRSNPHASQDPSRKYSWTSSSGRASFTGGVSNLFRNLSVSKIQREEENNRGRGMARSRRPKQLAVLPSPYQKYGAEVWFAKNKKARKNLLGQGDIQRAPKKRAGTRFVTQSDLAKRPGLKKKRSENVKEAYQQGANQLRHVLGVDSAGPKEKQKKSHRLGFGLGRTISAVRRERLKQSIAVIGPARQPVATQVDDQWV